MASQTDFSPLISDHELAQILGDPTTGIVDCRFSLDDPDRGKRDWLTARIQGARYAHLDNDLSAPIADGSQGRHPMPDPNTIASLKAAWGFKEQTLIVCYDDSGGAFASRLWWMLRWIGHHSVRVLNGGWQAWVDGGHSIDSRSLPAQKTANPGQHVVSIQSEMIADAADLMNPGFNLVDARASERYQGLIEPIDSVAGHIPGASNLPWQGNLDSNGHFLSADEIHNRWNAVGGSDKAIVYCGSGVTACHNILAAAVAGLPLPRLFPPSWSGWIANPDNPVESHGA